MKILFIANSTEGTLKYRVQLPCKALGADYAVMTNAMTMQAMVNDKVVEMRSYDIIIWQFAYNQDQLMLIRKLQRANVKIVIDLDDDYINSNKFYPIDYSDGRMTRLIEAVAMADLVTVTTPALAETYGKHNSNVKILPNMIDISEFNIKHNEYDGVVGWYSSGIRYTEFNDIVGGWLPEQAKLYLAGSYVFNNFKHNNKKTVTDTFLPADIAEILANIDIGIIPLSLCKFNDGKSDLKGLEMNISGIPVCASKTMPYQKYIQEGKNGFLIKHRRDWTKYLNPLLNDKDLRDYMSVEAKKIASKRDINKNINLWKEAYQCL